MKAVFAALVLLCGAATAQVPLPKDLSGRWTVESLRATNIFSLDDIAAGPDGTFTAKLTWWTRNPSCTLRKEPLAGRVTPTGISFEVTTKCNNKFVAELNRQDSGWSGKAVTVEATPVTAELTAR